MCYTRAMDENAPVEVLDPIPPLEKVSAELSMAEVQESLPTKKEAEETYLPPLSREQDEFVLAYMETGGNVAAAYRMVFGENVKSPSAKGYALLALPQVQARLAELTEAVNAQTLISIGSHLQELAEIRDMAKMQGQLKIALQAERSRGEVAGLYNHFEHGRKETGQTNIQINLVSKYDANI